MDSKKVIAQLIKIAEKQQKIINRLAQAAPAGSEPAPQHLEPATTTKRPAEAILAALPPNSGVQILEVHGEEVKVRAKPGANQQAVYNAVFKTVTQLQQSNVLQGSSYKISFV